MSTIQPHIDYCLSVWGSCTQTDINAIQILQNRAARIINRCYDYNVRSSDLIKQLGWVSIDQRYNYFMSVIIFKCLHQSSSNIISESFIYANDTHLYATRYASNNNLHVPKPHTNYMKHSISYRGVMCFNSLPSDFKALEHFHHFKRCSKGHFISA